MANKLLPMLVICGMVIIIQLIVLRITQLIIKLMGGRKILMRFLIAISYSLFFPTNLRFSCLTPMIFFPLKIHISSKVKRAKQL